MSSDTTPHVQPDGTPEYRDAGIPGTRSYRASDKIPPGVVRRKAAGKQPALAAAAPKATAAKAPAPKTKSARKAK